MSALISGMMCVAPLTDLAQNAAVGSAATSNLTADYPDRDTGVLIQGADWVAISAVTPAKVRAKNGIAASFSYGAVRAVVEADYSGEHAAVEVAPGQPTICVCRFGSIPGDPLLVKLHTQRRGMRELDGGKLPIIGGKVAEADKNDAVAINLSHPEATVWLLRPQEPLPPGEYAVMLGAQNVGIYPFTVRLQEMALHLKSTEPLAATLRGEPQLSGTRSAC
jgi:hypothetical protein